MFNLTQYSHLKPDSRGWLQIENICFKDIVDEFGTPVYVYSFKRIKENCMTLLKTFEKRFKNKIFYSYKTNMNTKLCNIIHETGIGAEVISEIELQTALKHVNPNMIVLDGPHKPLQLVRTAVEHGVNLINADSLEELKIINNVAEELKVTQKVGLTLNPDPDSKIGVALDESELLLLEKYVNKLNYIKLSALHCHLRTQNFDLNDYVEMLTRMSGLSKRIKAKTGFEINFFDLGGGLPEAAVIGKKINELADKIRERIEDLDLNGEIYFEPGRFIVGDAAVLLTKVLNIKKILDRRWIIVDAGSNIISPLSKANHRFTVANRLLEDYSKEYAIGGPLPASFDVLNRSYCLPERIEVGDYIGIINAGAYCDSFAIRFGESETVNVLIENGKVTRI
ncbi:MAG: hypothetical protein OdinLCB4_001730 [Candidatus Odinarchaeum yellowstonii]|uniref:Diaminopimelate decarboxylase n=1 Tax=Odinarchaeota yellowstonii (strain LCB_4) TaxID=1841599 RepID=A0AAF0IBE5_ODILC|nr:MAG: hypothetical protein OdinLCB4_001730 [Candidatus Odinarchaeum yellowstonii]